MVKTPNIQPGSPLARILYNPSPIPFKTALIIARLELLGGCLWEVRGPAWLRAPGPARATRFAAVSRELRLRHWENGGNPWEPQPKNSAEHATWRSGASYTCRKSGHQRYDSCCYNQATAIVALLGPTAHLLHGSCIVNRSGGQRSHRCAGCRPQLDELLDYDRGYTACYSVDEYLWTSK